MEGGYGHIYSELLFSKRRRTQYFCHLPLPWIWSLARNSLHLTVTVLHGSDKTWKRRQVAQSNMHGRPGLVPLFELKHEDKSSVLFPRWSVKLQTRCCLGRKHLDGVQCEERYTCNLWCVIVSDFSQGETINIPYWWLPGF